MIVYYAFPNTDYRMEWNGGHYINLFYRDNNFDRISFDRISFSWEKDRPSQRDALDVIISHLSYIEELA